MFQLIIPWIYSDDYTTYAPKSDDKAPSFYYLIGINAPTNEDPIVLGKHLVRLAEENRIDINTKFLKIENDFLGKNCDEFRKCVKLFREVNSQSFSLFKKNNSTLFERYSKIKKMPIEEEIIRPFLSVDLSNIT
jgi:hypothetical protein